jgi:hypothetical protein|tara:strand:- start:250 stop:708 length:459 start_codon:yes stop_codon:yes gene_type:complete
MKVKSFRGIIADGGQQKIRLSTNNGLTGYKIKKFQTISNQNAVGGAAGEHFTFIWAKEQDSVSSTTPNIDFSDPLLLAVCWAPNNVERAFANPIIFDNVTVNQDIYVTHMDIGGSEKNNYYIELEQVKLDLNEATVATLKDMRAGPDTNFGP